MEVTLDASLTDEILYARFTRALNDCNIDEFGILPFVPDTRDTRPEWHPFLVDDSQTKLGMPMVCWAPLIGAAYGVLKPIVNRRCEEGSQPWWENQLECGRVVESTRCLMALCPDSYIAMNARKRLVQVGVLDPSDELEYLDVVLTITRNCKSAGVWHHRKWLLCFMHPTIDKVPLCIAIIERHLAACHRAAELYPKCYYAWTTRHWLVDQLARTYVVPSAAFHEVTKIESSVHSDTSSHANSPFDPAQRSMLAEWRRMGEHVERNVSDHSSFQHFQHVLLKMSGRYVVNEDPSWRARLSHEWNDGEASTKVEAKGQQQQEPLSTSRRHDEPIALCWDRKALHARRHKSRGRIQALEQLLKSPNQQPQQPPQEEHEETRLALRLLQSERFIHELWQNEADRVRRLIETFPGHETLWYHLRFVYYGLCWLDSAMLDGEGIGMTTATSSSGYVTPDTERLFVQRILGHNVEVECEGQGTTNDAIASHTRNEVEEQGVLVDVIKAQQECSRRYLTWIDRLDR